MKGKSLREQVLLAEGLMLAPAVMAMRMPILMAEAAESMLRGRPESTGAVLEKWSALAEGMAKAQLALTRELLMMPLTLARGAGPARPLADLGAAVAVAALTPAARQVRKNHRRLSRKKR
jgi:hypothetical protein